MMRLDSIIDEIANVLKESEALSDVKIISAYPYQVKPTRLKTAVIAIGINSLDLESNQIEGSTKSGELSVFVDIFVPSDRVGKYACKLLCDMCDALDRYNIVGISAQKPEFNSETQTILLKTTITFNDEVRFGGADNE